MCNFDPRSWRRDPSLATRTSVRECLKVLDAITDPKEDLLLVHMATNGGFMLAEGDPPRNRLSVTDGKQRFDGVVCGYQRARDGDG